MIDSSIVTAGLEKMATERRNPDTLGLDKMTSLEIAAAMNREDAKVAGVIEGSLKEIALAIDAAAEAFGKGGRLIYMGAGTSGRLGVLDASECPPTFGVPDTMVIGLIAGGRDAMFKAKEGAEDDPALGREDLLAIGLDRRDVVVGLAASGRTPYVIGGLQYAREIGARTVALACNSASEIGRNADIVIEAEVGPEVLTGSTRLKAGTAQKMILNMISTGAMVRTGKTYENLMVDVQQTNLKLVDRARRMVMLVTEASGEEAEQALKEAGGSAKLAILMLLLNIGAPEAAERLEKAGGFIRRAIEQK